jgi:hypothetical protein
MNGVVAVKGRHHEIDAMLYRWKKQSLDGRLSH